MKSDIIKVTNSEGGFESALSASAASALYRGLDKKESLHLQLLSEEMLGMMRQITGVNEAEFWVGSEGKAFELNLLANPIVTGKMRKELLSVSTSGKNEAAKGFMGKLRDIFNTALAPEEAVNVADYYSQGIVMPSGYYASDPAAYSLSADIVTWSMQKYKASVEAGISHDAKAKEEWDELEKSIVANIADEVRISITGDRVQMTVYKKF